LFGLCGECEEDLPRKTRNSFSKNTNEVVTAREAMVFAMFAVGGTLLIIFGFYALFTYRLTIGVIDTIVLAGLLLVGWQLRNGIWANRKKQRVKTPLLSKVVIAGTPIRAGIPSRLAKSREQGCRAESRGAALTPPKHQPTPHVVDGA
jgi:hypothetical protein